MNNSSKSSQDVTSCNVVNIQSQHNISLNPILIPPNIVIYEIQMDIFIVNGDLHPFSGHLTLKHSCHNSSSARILPYS